MKIIERLKSPIVWLGIGSTIIAVSGIEPSNMTEWGILFDNLMNIFKNPFLFISCGIAIYSYLNNPTDKDNF